MKLLYFAWLKVKIGVAEEEVAPPPEVTTVAALLDWLEARDRKSVV
jgi:molybdopterin synthase sulfur carrier subunit